MTKPLWHLLQISDVLDLEFGAALAESVPLLCWEPRRTFFPGITRIGKEPERLAMISPGHQDEGHQPSSAERVPFRVRSLPLLRGYARPLLSSIARFGPTVLARLLRQTPDPAHSPLICTVPYFAAVAELWPGPVIYWLTDLIAEYASADRETVRSLDQRLCQVATLVCPNSERLRTYLIHQAGCDPDKIEIIPNATRASNLVTAPTSRPAPLPEALEAVNRPIAGVIGNLAGNMDWVFLERLVDLTPWLSWVFVGPTTMSIADPLHNLARAALLTHPRTYFVGKQPYGALAHFARAFDVAVLPYLRSEPTFSGSSTRFYEHLAACRPMIATAGLEELTRKTDFLTLVETPEQAHAALEQLRSSHFDDGRMPARWNASQLGTWQVRAQQMQQALALRTIQLPEQPAQWHEAS